MGAVPAADRPDIFGEEYLSWVSRNIFLATVCRVRGGPDYHCRFVPVFIDEWAGSAELCRKIGKGCCDLLSNMTMASAGNVVGRGAGFNPMFAVCTEKAPSETAFKGVKEYSDCPDKYLEHGYRRRGRSWSGSACPQPIIVCQCDRIKGQKDAGWYGSWYYPVFFPDRPMREDPRWRIPLGDYISQCWAEALVRYDFGERWDKGYDRIIDMEETYLGTR